MDRHGQTWKSGSRALLPFSSSHHLPRLKPSPDKMITSHLSILHDNLQRDIRDLVGSVTLEEAIQAVSKAEPIKISLITGHPELIKEADDTKRIPQKPCDPCPKAVPRPKTRNLKPLETRKVFVSSEERMEILNAVKKREDPKSRKPMAFSVSDLSKFACFFGNMVDMSVPDLTSLKHTTDAVMYNTENTSRMKVTEGHVPLELRAKNGSFSRKPNLHMIDLCDSLQIYNGILLRRMPLERCEQVWSSREKNGIQLLNRPERLLLSHEDMHKKS